MVVAFMLGLISALSLMAAVYFLRFWRDTRDVFFVPFAVFFFVEAVTRVVLVFSPHPNEGSAWIYISRLLALVLILTGILYKNYGRSA